MKYCTYLKVGKWRGETEAKQAFKWLSEGCSKPEQDLVHQMAESWAVKLKRDVGGGCQAREEEERLEESRIFAGGMLLPRFSGWMT